MVRLENHWIVNIGKTLGSYNNQLKAVTGLDLFQLAAASRGLTEEDMRRRLPAHKAAVIPVTAGQGLLSAFAGNVAEILRSLGMETIVTAATDVAGVWEAGEAGADLLFMADDDRFLALNRRTGQMGEGSDATALGYVTALFSMAGWLGGSRVLLLGYGRLGRIAANYLKEAGARVSVWDADPRRLAEAEGYHQLSSVEEIAGYAYIFDATDQGNWLEPQLLHPKALIAAPGIPLSLTAPAQHSYEKRCVHDLMQIGVAVLLSMVI